MPKKYDLVVKIGTYQSNGETKNKYENIGAVIEGGERPLYHAEEDVQSCRRTDRRRAGFNLC